MIFIDGVEKGIALQFIDGLDRLWSYVVIVSLQGYQFVDQIVCWDDDFDLQQIIVFVLIFSGQLVDVQVVQEQFDEEQVQVELVFEVILVVVLICIVIWILVFICVLFINIVVSVCFFECVCFIFVFVLLIVCFFEWE